MVFGAALFAFAPLHPRTPCRTRGALLPTCCAASDGPNFDELLNGVLTDTKSAGSVDKALDTWMDQMDETFIPTLASKMEVAPEAEMPQLNELMTALQQRSQVHARPPHVFCACVPSLRG